MFEGFENDLGLIQRGSASFLRFGSVEAFKSPEYADGMFAVIATGGAEFIEDEGFGFARGVFIPEKDCLDVFSF